MFGGNSGSSGIVIYDTKKQGDNAVYGYYLGNEMHFETGTVEEMRERRNSRERSGGGKKDGLTLKRMGILFLIYIIVVTASFAFVSIRIGIAVLVFCLFSYAPVLVIVGANSKLYASDEDFSDFRRNHGCEHAIIQSLTKGKEATVEELRKTNIYDTECGTAYSGYIVFMALVLALLIVFWPGFLKALGLIALAALLLLIMIIVPAINPFTMLQHPVVSRPGDREYELGVEIMKRVKEL